MQLTQPTPTISLDAVNPSVTPPGTGSSGPTRRNTLTTLSTLSTLPWRNEIHESFGHVVCLRFAKAINPRFETVRVGKW